MSTTLEKVQADAVSPEQTRCGLCFAPNVDIVELDDRYELLADVPGATADSIEIDYERGLLTLRAHIEPRGPKDGAAWLLREFGVGDFHRAFQIGEGIDASGIRASVNAGVLKLHLPKSPAARTRRIQVSATN